LELNLNELKGRNILVTGGAGFIGSNLVDTLSSVAKVIVFDNMSSGLMSNLRKSRNLIKIVKGDILDKDRLKEVMADTEYVFHLAANVGNVKSIEDPTFDMEVNIKGTINVLEACVNSHIKRLVYSSSGAIFGEAKYIPIDEEHPVHPESPYGVSKLAAEKYCFAFHKIHGLPVTALRYFNAFGPRQKSSRAANVISVFFSRIREGKPLTIYGDGTQTRDFVSTRDIIQANVLAATQPGAIGEVFNVATGKEYDLNFIIKIINRISGKENKVNYTTPRAGEVQHSRANIEKICRVLGYRPQTDIEKDIQQTWQEEGEN
jgi:UDP-glucose 4-epimerase